MGNSDERPPRRTGARKDLVAPASGTRGSVWPQQAAKAVRDSKGKKSTASADKPVRETPSGIRRERPASAAPAKRQRGPERDPQRNPPQKQRGDTDAQTRRPAHKLAEQARNAAAAAPESREGIVERKLYGLNACLSFVRLRGDDIIRAYFVEDVARQHFGKLMKLLAETRRAYHVVDADELEKVTESTHHEGVCLLVRDAPVLRIGEWLAQPRANAEIVLALEDVGNPHNLGAIMRTAAHFGVAAIVLSGAERLRSGAAMRTAAGGAENVPILEASGFVDALKALRNAGYAIATTSSHKGQSVFTTTWPSRVCIVVGEEQHGVSRAVQQLADQNVSIPGTGAVESLNVSVATAIVLAQCANAQQAIKRTAGTLSKSRTK